MGLDESDHRAKEVNEKNLTGEVSNIGKDYTLSW